MGASTRIRYRVTKEQRVILCLSMKLGNSTEFAIGMKVRATYLDPPLWFYGKIHRIGSEKYIDVRVEKTSLPVFIGTSLCFHKDEKSWVEPYDY